MERPAVTPEMDQSQSCAAINRSLQQLWDAIFPRRPAAQDSYPPISSIPRTSAARLERASQGTIDLNGFDEPRPAATIHGHDENKVVHGDYGADKDEDTVLYLAYGSNLCAATFLGKRGIRPISQVNVTAPTLRLTFDLAGMPYTEPCFANTAIRKIPKPKPPPGGVPLPPDVPPPKVPPVRPPDNLPPTNPPQPQPQPPEVDPPGRTPPDPPKVPPPPYFSPPLSSRDLEAARPPPSSQDPEWDSGLIGVVYELTPSDFAHVIATEGGGAAYSDILVACLPLPEPAAPGIPEKPPPKFPPELPPKPFLAHTLFMARVPVNEPPKPPEEIPRWPPSAAWRAWWTLRVLPWLLHAQQRPDPSYAQPSLRYLDLLRTGAQEHGLPPEYQRYLAQLRPYTRTTCGQEIGRVLTLVLIGPLLSVILFLGSIFGDKKNGRLPLWLAVLAGAFFRGMWAVYDGFERKWLGDGERTLGEDDGMCWNEKTPLLRDGY